MKILNYIMALTVIVAASVPAEYVSAGVGKFPHVNSTVTFPPTQTRNFRHTIRLHIPQESSALSRLSIEVPKGLTVRNDITVSDQSGQEIDATISINGRQLTVTFPEPVAPGTLLNIAMNNVRRFGSSNVWLYHLSAKVVGTEVDIPLGVAQFRVYS